MVSLAQRILSGLNQRLRAEDVTPERMACLFMIDPMVRSYFPAFRETISERLLDYTIACALEASPWYREAYGNYGYDAGRIFSLNDLQHLPVLHRHTLEHEGHLLRASNLHFGSAAFTTGTTSMRPLIIDNSEEEHRFVRDFFTITQQGRSDGEQRIGLNLSNTYHGQLVEIPTAYKRIHVSGNTMSGLHTAQTLLTRGYVTPNGIRHVSAVGGPLIALLRLTAFLEAQQMQAKLPPMDFIQSTSEYLTPHALKALRSFWNCPVEDRYGLSEIIIGAWRCGLCNHYHFEPYGIAEVTGINDYLPAGHGRGRLLLTGFAPFMQMTPLIRYVTGDCVEITNADCPSGETCYRLLGRLQNSMVYNGKLLAGEYEILDVLDGEPDIFRRRMYRYLPEYLQEVGSPPRFHITAGETGPSLTIELRYDPAAFPDRTEALRQRITLAFAAREFALKLHFTQGSDENVLF